ADLRQRQGSGCCPRYLRFGNPQLSGGRLRQRLHSHPHFHDYSPGCMRQHIQAMHRDLHLDGRHDTADNDLSHGRRSGLQSGGAADRRQRSRASGRSRLLQPQPGTQTVTDSGFTHTGIFTAEAKDACGNTSAPCTVTYTWTGDPTPPTITSKPAGGDLGCNPDPSSLPTDASVSAQVTATDNCSGTPTISVTHTETSSSCLTTRTFTITATDGCKNQSSATVVYPGPAHPTPPPTVCPGAPPVQLPPDQCAAKVNYAPSASDNCTVASVVCVPPSGSSFPPGVTSVTCTATD